MRPDERESLRRHFRFRCGYCGVRESDVGAELTVDHFQPLSRGGEDTLENAVYCCHPCREFKGDAWNPNSPQHVLHPLYDDVAEHVVEETDGTLRAISATGEFHISRLHLNRPPLVAYRQHRRLRQADRREQTRLAEQMRSLEEQVQALTDELERLLDRQT